MNTSANQQALLLVIVAALFAACGAEDDPSTNADPVAETPTKKRQVLALLEAIESGASEPVGVVHPDLIQHNLSEADGLAGLGEVLAQLPKGSARVNTVRAFEDGDFVFTQTDYDFFGPKIGFDIFRFEDGKIVEHWDNLQEKPGEPNPSGRTMTDGPTDISGLDDSAANKALVAEFLDVVIIQGKAEHIADYLRDDLIQHNPLEADGIAGLGAFLMAQAEAGTPLSFSEVHDVYGEGNFVLSVSEGSFAGEHSAFYDLFRIEAGKIAEHWDAIQTIPPRDEWKNDNGKF